MKITLIIILIILFLAITLKVISLKSKDGIANGLIDERLTQCPRTPNCICSEFSQHKRHYVAPFPLSTENNTQNLNHLNDVIQHLNGEIQTQTDDYIAATFSTFWFGFIDDVEFRLDTKAQVIHIRSASRVGKKDFGANLKRIEQIKTLLSQS